MIPDPPPLNSIVDHEGRLTTDPKVLFEEPYGSLLPFGGHKGYGLLVFCELFAGILSGGGTINSFDSTTEGTFNFHEWVGDGYAILFSHPKDFTTICATELGYMAGLADGFAKRNTKISSEYNDISLKST